MPEEKTAIEQPTVIDRKSAIAAAVAAAGEPVEEQVETTQTRPEPVEKKTEKAPVETKSDEEKEREEQEERIRQQGADLIRALNDPEKAKIVVKFLMEKTGVGSQTPETKEEAKEATDEIMEALLESLKDENESLDMSFLAKKLAPAMKKIQAVMLRQVEEKQTDIREEFQRQETEKLTGQSARAMEKIAQDFFQEDELPENVIKVMSAYMDRYNPSPDMSVKEYIQDAFDYAKGKLDLKKVDKKTQQRVEKNRNDAASRLASERAPREDNLHTERPKLSRDATRQLIIQQAVEQAERG